MGAKTWFRVTAVLMLLFAAGHTFGFLAFRPPTPEAKSVWDAMNSVHFAAGKSTFSYGGFYRGFGLSITVSQLFFAWLAWILSSMAERGAVGVKQLAWGMVLVQVAGIALSLKYFSLGPALFSAVGAVLFAMGALRTRDSAQAMSMKA